MITIFIGPPTLVGIGTLEFTLVRASVRASVWKILNDYPLYFSEICMELQLYMGGINILGFLKIILVASPGALLWLKKAPKCPKMAKNDTLYLITFDPSIVVPDAEEKRGTFRS